MRLDYLKKKDHIEAGTCSFCGRRGDLEAFDGMHPACASPISLKGADAVKCNSCGFIRVDNDAFLDNLVLMGNDIYVSEVFLTMFQDSVSEYKGSSEAKETLTKLYESILDLKLDELMRSVVHERRTKALALESSDLPFERFAHIHKVDFDLAAEEAERIADTARYNNKCPYKLEPKGRTIHED